MREMDEIAGQIQAELPRLLDPSEADEVGARLTALRARLGAGQAVEDDIVRLLAEREPTRTRLDDLLPASELLGDRSFSPLPGRSPAPPAAEFHRCPLGDYVWPRADAGEPVPRCPTHGVALEQFDASKE